MTPALAIRIAISLAIVMAAFGSGYKVRDWQCDAAAARAQQAAHRAVTAANVRANDVGAGYERERAVAASQATETRTIIRETYRDVPIRTDCTAPATARGMLDAATGAANAATGQSDSTMPAAAPPAGND